MIARRFRFLCYMFEMMFSFCFRGVTGMGTGWVRVSFDTQFVLRLSLILMMFYVWFGVLFDTQFVLRLSLILMMFSVWF